MALCALCPRKCEANRETAAGLKKSICGAPARIKVALASLHPYEEPVIAGEKGAGTVFFSHCNLKCVFCQNHEISQEGFGLEISRNRLIEIFLELQTKGAATLELVTPGHYTDEIVEALKTAKDEGLKIPVVWNSNAYESPESLMMLSGLVDIFMPDMKYFDNRAAARYSGVRDYFRIASEAIQTMFRLTGPFQMAGDSMRRGVLIRHLVLPGMTQDSCRILNWIYERFGDAVYVSIMNQYMPIYKAERFPEINRPLMTAEYQRVVRHARTLGFQNAFIQVGKTQDTRFIPVFDGKGV